jgi:hypothetical protein
MMDALNALGSFLQAKGHEERPMNNGEQRDTAAPMAEAIPAMNETNLPKEKDKNGMGRVSQGGASEEYGEVEQTTPPDPLFDNEEGTGVKYKTCEWWNVGFLMIAECISLGILSLPHAMATLGLVR